ncbi:MAG: 16S rRNA processing protein RimM [Alphaproteobacteria bacterium]|nr:16S rRNA processing protein RimM [Alphaproteobacteria bacterium]
MSAPPRLVVVGQIAGAFGVKGEARVRSFTADPEACFSYGPLMDEAGAVVLTPVRHRPLNEGFGVIAREQRQREDWEAMKGLLLHVPRVAMPEPEEDEVYVTDLIGLAVEHVDGRALGVVTDAPNFGAGDLIEVKPPRGGVFYLPFTHAVVPEVDLSARRLRVDPDEDLLPEALQRQSGEGDTN